MSHSTPRHSLDSLRKEAKRWLHALRANDADAHARLNRALPNAPVEPALGDVQHALAREHGFAGWTALKHAVEQATAAEREVGSQALARYEAMADALLAAYRTGTPEAMERHYRYTWHRRSWPAMRTYVQLDLGKRPSAPDQDIGITLDDARHLVALEHGFDTWDALKAFTDQRGSGHVPPRSRSASSIPPRLKMSPRSPAPATGTRSSACSRCIPLQAWPQPGR